MSTHRFVALPADDMRQDACVERLACNACGVLRSPRFGGGFVYSPGGHGRSDWTRERPSCLPRPAAPEEKP